MDNIDRIIISQIQQNSRLSNAEIAGAAGISVSTANDRLRKLARAGVITAWRAVPDARAMGAGLCAFLMVDIGFENEAESVRQIGAMDEVQEIHHISGPHSCLLKIRVADPRAMQRFLQEKLKPVAGITRTESVIVLDTLKETSAVAIRMEPEP